MGENKPKDKNGSSVGSSEQVEKISNISSSKTDSSDGSVNIAIECALSGNVERFVQCFDNESDPFHDTVATLINTRSEKDNRSALDWAALAGNVTMLSELIKHGADINAVSEKGYSALHMAAAWNRVESLKVLIDSGVDCDLKNIYNEVARDVAARYKNHICVNYLDSAEARNELKTYLHGLKEQFANIEKMKALTKEEKSLVTDLLATKFEWFENTTNATMSEIQSTREELENALAPIFNKLGEPADVKLKAQKKK